MQWQKLGIVWKPDGSRPWAKSHGAIPTPVKISDEVVRVYVTCLDEQGRGRPTYVDVAAADPTRVLRTSSHPLLDPGEAGSFDDNGLMALSVIRADAEHVFMYYAGFELCTHIRYRIFTGLAISADGGTTFARYSRTPVLDRTDDELFFRCGSFVMLDDVTFKLWYIAGSEWTSVAGKPMPVYDLRYQESIDGICWQPQGKLSLAISGEDEHGFGRPWVVKRGPSDYQLFYSIRRRSLAAYRLGYAESSDGISWTRKDDELGLTTTPDAFDAHAIMYSAIITIGKKTYCFYNGDNFGEQGFALAVLV